MTPYRTPEEAEPPPPAPPRTLGDRRSTHRVARSARLQIAIGLLVAMVLGVVSFAMQNPVAAIIALMLFLLVALLGGVSQWTLGMGAVVELYDDGIVVRRSWTETVTIFFEDIDSIFYDFETTSRFGATITPSVKITLVGFDKKRLVIPRGLRDASEIAKELDRKVVRPLLAPAKRAVDDGEVMKFGLVEVDHDGVQARGEHYEWKDIARVEARPESITFYAKEKDRRITSVPVSDIPHPRVLVALLGTRVPVESPPGFWGI